VDKSPDAFRTISEVADDLDLPQHVLRFWETRFNQIKPLKRGGGRRYYRPDDVLLLRGIKHLLYGEGYTIKGVQRILKEQGLRYVQMVWRDDLEEELPPLSHAHAEDYAPRSDRGEDRREPMFGMEERPGPEAFAPKHIETFAVNPAVIARRSNFEPIIEGHDEVDEPEHAPHLELTGSSNGRPSIALGGRNRLEAALRELAECRKLLDVSQ
jgi:DNA-binding transcriptional MerR regulator